MEVLIFDDEISASKKAYELFEESYHDNARVFGLATGSTPVILYDMISKSSMDFSDRISINLDEYYGLDASSPQSYHYFMGEHLFKYKKFENSYLFDGSNKDAGGELQAFREYLAKNPIDLQILGIGPNGHIGFNEPGTPFTQEDFLVNLSDETIKANSRFFDDISDVPTKAYTMGIAEIMSAKKIILMAFGDNKAKAIESMINGPVTIDIPGSVLQNHRNVVVILDKKAGKYLNKNSK